MTRRKPLEGIALAGLLLLLCAGVACTDTDLYQWKTTPYQANKLTVSGTVCTDDLHQSDFPKKILFIVDMSQSLRGPSNDPNGRRGKAIEDLINLRGKDPNYYFGITVFGSKARNLLTDASGQQPIGFTRDFARLSAAARQVKSGGIDEISTCRSGRCRDVRAALSLASSIITGDVLASDPGEVARTTYMIILLSGGPPVPALGRCACRDLEEEKEGGEWEGCPWEECDNCRVTCPANSVCDGNECHPECDPPCDSDEYCDENYNCTEGTPVALPTVPPVSSVPPSTPDTFSFRVPPPNKPGQCKSLTCVFPAGGHPNSCEEQLLVLDVRELKAFAEKNGVGQFQLHTTYLPDQETRDPADPFYPPGPGPCAGDQAANDARTVRLLSQMAYAGGGGFHKIAAADLIPGTFDEIARSLFSSNDALVFKELVVSNANVRPDSDGIHPDTDADGLHDDLEAALSTCISDRDTDGDGLSDAVEVKLASDPLKPDAPVECVDLESTQEVGDDPCAPGTDKTWVRYTVDKDKDGFNSCEERLLGTDDSLYDTDADGFPDHVEFAAGTNYLAVDQLKDHDMDGVENREEIRGHTDPRSTDAQSQLDLAYRYDEVDEGLKTILSVSQPTNITGVTIKNVSAATSPGRGWLKFEPGPPPTLAWRDYSDRGAVGTFGPPVDISQGDPEGYRLTSCRLTSGGGCSDNSAAKFITVMVDGAGSYPPSTMVEQVNVTSALRNCLRFTVRNITLMETGMDPLLGSTGNNTVNIYFAEAPDKAKTGYGMFRIASIRLRYEKGPPERRTPKTPEITLTDDDFVLDISR